MITLEVAIRTCKRLYVLNVLRQTNGNQSEAAKIAGIARPSFCRLMRALGIAPALERRLSRRKR